MSLKGQWILSAPCTGQLCTILTRVEEPIGGVFFIIVTNQCGLKIICAGKVAGKEIVPNKSIVHPQHESFWSGYQWTRIKVQGNHKINSIWNSMELHNGSKWDPLRTRTPTVRVSAQRPIRTTFGTVPFGRSHNNRRRSEQW